MPLGARLACVRWPGNDTATCGHPAPLSSIHIYNLFKDYWANQMRLQGLPDGTSILENGESLKTRGDQHSSCFANLS